MTKGKTADEDGDAREDGIEEIEGTYSAHTDEVEERALNAQIGERLMQALEDSICPMLLLWFVWHKTSYKGESKTSGEAPIRPRANSGH
jgi:hypothetical protein